MKINICFLYPDIMNLYGDYANVRALERHLVFCGAEVNVTHVTFADNADFSDCDMVYVGAGTERALLLCLNDIKKYEAQLKKAYENGAVFLCTGNSVELFGKETVFENGERREGLGLVDVHSTHTDKRVLTDVVFESNSFEKETVGFINKASSINGGFEPWFKVKYGSGNIEGSGGEGIKQGSFHGTYLNGPLLIKNPHILSYFAKLLIEKKGGEMKPLNLENETKAYEITLSELVKRFAQ